MTEKFGLEEAKKLYSSIHNIHINASEFKIIYEEQLNKIKYIREHGFFFFKSHNVVSNSEVAYVIYDLTNAEAEYLLYDNFYYPIKYHVSIPEFLNRVKLGSIIVSTLRHYTNAINLFLKDKNLHTGYYYDRGILHGHRYEYMVKQKFAMTKCARKI